MNIEYRILYDEHHCEDCGYSSAVGAIIHFDNKEVYRLEPIAHCYDSVSLRNKNGMECNVEEIILELLGHNVKEISS